MNGRSGSRKTSAPSNLLRRSACTYKVSCGHVGYEVGVHGNRLDSFDSYFLRCLLFSRTDLSVCLFGCLFEDEIPIYIVLDEYMTFG